MHLLMQLQMGGGTIRGFDTFVTSIMTSLRRGSTGQSENQSSSFVTVPQNAVCKATVISRVALPSESVKNGVMKLYIVEGNLRIDHQCAQKTPRRSWRSCTFPRTQVNKLHRKYMLESV